MKEPSDKVKRIHEVLGGEVSDISEDIMVRVSSWYVEGVILESSEGELISAIYLTLRTFIDPDTKEEEDEEIRVLISAGDAVQLGRTLAQSAVQIAMGQVVAETAIREGGPG